MKVWRHGGVCRRAGVQECRPGGPEVWRPVGVYTVCLRVDMEV